MIGQLQGKVIEDTAKPNDPSEWISKLTDGIDTVKGLIDAGQGPTPCCLRIAWGIISSCVNILKQRTERDKTVLRLYEVMIMTYKEASDYRRLWQQQKLAPIYKSLFQTTNECGMLIKGYTNKTRFKRFFSLNVTQKAEEFIQGFANLREQLNSGVAKDALVVTLGVRANVDILAMKTLLQELRPGQELGPKSVCMPGTRVETINYLMTWIAEYDDSVLWCSGLAGTGKSSLVGTLHKLLGFHMGSHSRLAAFIRYDRTSYSNSSELITSIAYSLGMFDQRIGDAIAKALDTSRAAVKMPVSESHIKFQLLVQEPLETIPELQDEGPLVVIIDGLDESEVSNELLKVLADGFGPKLPFMRLIVSSRPEEKIARVFKNCRHVHCYSLDTSSEEVKLDIQYFIRQRFTSIDNGTVWGKHNKEDVITWLAERASGLFIWAATVCSFLCGFPCLWRLNVLLETTIPADAMEALTILYRTALDTIVSEVPGTKEDVQRCIRAVLGALIVRKRVMSVPMLTELVLQEGDPSAQFIVDKLGSVVQDFGGCLVLIHKSFDDFLRDHGRCGDLWFIDVKEHEKELARRCVLSLTMFFKDWTSPCALPGSMDICLRATTWDQSYNAIPSHIKDYAVEVLECHLDAFVRLGIDTYRPLFDRYFLFWLEILYAFKHPLPVEALLKVVSVVNAEVTDEKLRTYVYHAFTFWDRFTKFSTKYPQVKPAYVYTHAMSISPSENLICRDWGQSSGVNAPFDKERLLALITMSISTSEITYSSYGLQDFLMFQGSRHIQFEFIINPHLLRTDMQSRGVVIYSKGPVLFDVDTGRIAETSPPSILLYFPDLLLPSSYGAETYHLDETFSATGGGQMVTRLMLWNTCCGDRSEYSFDSTPYEIIEGHDSDPQDAMISNVDEDNDHDNRSDNGIMPPSICMFISIANTQTSRCDNYFLPAVQGDGGDWPVVKKYAHGLLVIEERSGLILNIEPRTSGCNKWMTLDGGTNGINSFVVMEDGSRLLGLTGAAGKISLREWETSTGGLCCERIYGRSYSFVIHDNTDHHDHRLP
ncbi:hypothetical protein EV421DRAFT_589816 [Armillaria borealis]|uniref:Nephrocystin 3-like N-terminal domain-containing protein n=1 Tax=Armillaria borealis TaxID=47425 RepID=A0AA39IE16_9AGAR|nr:hypothetical protein EV421DRAFT_589816 [Armillaria borealis]